MSKSNEQLPFIIKILSWYGILFGGSYILYGTVSIILGILDRNYTTVGDDFIITLYGIPVLVVAMAFKNFKQWGWYGYAGLLALVIIWSFIAYSDINGIIVGILSAIALIGLFYPGVRKHYFPA